MNTLVIFNRPPYDGSDVTWNGLRLAGKLMGAGHAVRLFLMNDSVDLARCGIHKNEPYYEGAHKATMTELAEWVAECERIVTF